jgi:hypothetical protein
MNENADHRHRLGHTPDCHVLDLLPGNSINIPARNSYRDDDVRDRPAIRPFGISWNGAELFVANHRRLLVFDDRLRYVRTARTPLQINIHQLAFAHDRVWAVSPWTNSVIGVGPAPSAPPTKAARTSSIGGVRSGSGRSIVGVRGGDASARSCPE